MPRRSRAGKSGVIVVLVVLAVGIALALFAKFGGGRKASPPPAMPAAPAPKAHPPTAPSAPAVIEGHAVLRGRVLYTGEPPPRKQLPVNKDPEVCECAPGDPAKKLPYKLDESLVVDPVTRGVANAVVWVKGVRGGPERLEVIVDQRGCQFVPHVALLTPGGKLLVLNPDPIAHNYHAWSKGPGNPTENLSFNKISRRKAYPAEGSFAKPEFVRVTCDVHDWMGMWVAVVENGFAVVTDAEGRFSILGLAPGTYTLGVWHEALARETVDRPVTLGADGAEIEIPFSP
jgi:hypothetical protein